MNIPIFHLRRRQYSLGSVRRIFFRSKTRTLLRAVFASSAFWLIFAQNSLVFAATESASTLDPTESTSRSSVRLEYVETDSLPDGLAYLLTMQDLTDLALDNQVTALSTIRDNMGFSRVETEEFLTRLTNSHESYQTEYLGLVQELACAAGSVSHTSDELYSLFESIDDLSGIVAAKYLSIFKTEIGTDAAARLQQWIESRKLVTTYVLVNHREHYAETGADPNATLTRICRIVEASN